jgi:hypothetical protein
MPKSGDDMPALDRTGAFVAAGFVALVGATVGSPSAVDVAASVSVGRAVGGAGVSVGGGAGLGASGGVTVALGAKVAGAAGRGVLVGVGVGPEATGEQELSARPAAIMSSSIGQRKLAVRA